MKLATIQRYGAVCLVTGAALMALYATGFALVLPIGEGKHDATRLVLHPAWMPLAALALAAVLLLMLGFGAVYTRLYATAGAQGLAGFVLVELAYLLQAAKLTWELCVYPVLARGPWSVVIRDRLLWASDPGAAFRAAASLTILAGVVLFCMALLRSPALPASGGLLVLVGAVIYALGPALGTLVAIVGVLIFAVGCLVLGLALAVTPAPLPQRGPGAIVV
jgi:hypothetical protein